MRTEVWGGKGRKDFRNSVLDHRMEYALAFFFSSTTLLGAFFDSGISFAKMNLWQMLAWISSSLALTEVIRRLLRLVCNALAGWARKEEATDIPGDALRKETKDFLSRKAGHCFLFSFFVILLCWLPVWLAYYPGLWNYDPWQVDQVITGIYSKHHPLLHTLLLGNCYRFALEQGNANLAPILYSAIQGGICAAVFALCCTLICEKTHSTIFFSLTLLFFALFPVHPILAMSTTKDTLFAALILLACLLFFFLEGKSPTCQKILLALETGVLALVILLRNNARYCFFLLIFLGLFLLKKRQWRKILAVLTAGTVLGLAADWGLGRLLQASPVLVAEMCSLPSQMAGRVQEQGGDLDNETADFFGTFYSLGKMSYNPYLADGMKQCLKLESRADLIQYLRGSLRLFLKYPLISIDSFLYTSEGLWNLRDVSHTRIYGVGNGAGYLVTDIQNWFRIEEDSKLPFLKQFLETQFSENAFLNIPILHFLFAPALYVDLLLWSLCVILKGKKRKGVVIPLFLLFLVFTIALGPGILPRYVYPLMVCAPLLIWMAMKSVPLTELDFQGREGYNDK